jgi:hypothetical protein
MWANNNFAKIPAVSRCLIEAIGIFYKNVHVGSRGLIETVETDPAVQLKQRKPILRSHWNRRYPAV